MSDEISGADTGGAGAQLRRADAAVARRMSYSRSRCLTCTPLDTIGNSRQSNQSNPPPLARGSPLQRIDQLAGLTYLLAFQKIGQFFGDALGRSRIPEIGGADLHGGGAGDQEFGRVSAGRDAAQTDHGNAHRAGGLADQPQSHGL